jgi:hypothetical protein
MRMSRRGRGQMPQLATTKIDEAGAALIRRWIEQLKNDDEPATAAHRPGP